MRKPCRAQTNPWLFAGVIMNAIYLLLDHFELDVFQRGWPAHLLCFWEGAALGLIIIGLILLSPERTQGIRDWKKAHFPALFR